MEDMKKLDKHPWCGHSVLMNKTKQKWQNVDYVYGLFSDKKSLARRRYRGFVEKGMSGGKRPDLSGGGLLRSIEKKKMLDRICRIIFLCVIIQVRGFANWNVGMLE